MAYRTASTAIIHELLDSEIIIANLDSGSYYSLRGSGVPIWQLLMAGYDAHAIVSLFSQRFSLDCQEPIDAFIQSLVKEDLIRGASIEQKLTDSNSLALVWPSEFKSPLFEKYEEMKNLLMLDPVHDVDAQGWPNRS
jgi:hypothetical protein